MRKEVCVLTDTDQRLQDEYWMRRAIDEAKTSMTLGEVPVGAVVVRDGEVIAT